MYYILKNPSHLQKLLDEIDLADKESRLSAIVTWQEAGKLPYFQACLKEALRESSPSLRIGLSDHFAPCRAAPSCWHDA